VEVTGFIVFGVIVAGLVFGYWRLSVSLRKWKQPPPGRDPEARQAEARLWSTRMPDQR
jgi:hypothetical protein